MISDFQGKYELMVKAVFIILISVSVNFLGNTVNCDLQDALTNIPIARHTCFILMLAFLMDFFNKSSMPPFKMIGTSIIVYIMFLLISKQGGLFLSINLGVILVIYLLSLQVTYTENQMKESKTINDKNKKKDEINKYNNIKKILIFSSTGLVLFGFGTYLRKQMIDYKGSFNFATFILGTNKCKQLS
jgi:hypothetical protein